MKISLACFSLVALGAFTLVTDGAHAADQRSYTGGRFTLSVGGVNAGYVKSVEGGTVVGDVAPEPPRPPAFPKKHLGGTHVEPLVAEVGLGAGPFASWITDTLNGTLTPKGITWSTADFNYKETSRVELDRSRLVQIDFPRMDGATKDPGFVRLTMQPEAARRAAANGADARASMGDKTRSWTTSNFRVAIAGLPADRVASVEPITVKVVGSTLSVSNLILSVSQADYKPWQDWHDAFVAARPEATEALEKTGTIDFLDPDMKGVIARLSFRGLGSVRCSSGKQSAGSEAAARFTSEMYVEDVKFTMDPRK